MRNAVLCLTLGGCVIVGGKDKPVTPTFETGDPTTDPPLPTDTAPPDPDDDMDGFTVGDGDCNDADPLIHPDALEICDTIDNNCDEAVDDAAAATLAGANYATITEAIAAVKDPKDGIDVCAGDHVVDTITLVDGDAVSLFAVSGRDETSLAETKGGAVAILNGGAILAMEGFSISGTTGSALEVRDESSLDLVESRVHDNTGPAIEVVGNGAGAVVTVDTTDIDTNGTAKLGDGGGISATGIFDIALTASTVTGNFGGDGAGIYASPTFGTGVLSLTDTEVSGNVGTGLGGGIAAISGLNGIFSAVNLTDSTISGNTALVGAGMYATTTVAGNKGGTSSIEGNTALADGGGLAVQAGSVSNLLVAGNDASGGSGGGFLALFVAANPFAQTLTDVVIDDNDANVGAGMYVQGGVDVEISGASAVTLNDALLTGGAAFLEGGADPASLQATDVNFGTPANKKGTNVVDDNTPDDLSTEGGGGVPPQTYDFEENANFACNGRDGCP